MIFFRGFKVQYTHVSSALSKSGLPGLNYALNPYVGCSHGCTYCYARLYTRDKRIAQMWGEIVSVKRNIVSILKDEVKKTKKGVVGIGTITDPYQPVESVFKLTNKCLEVLFENKFRVSIQTKNTLILRDLDLLVSNRELVDVGLTITTFNKDVVKAIEPKSPPPEARVRALREISSLRIKTWVFYGPIIAGLNDDMETINSIVELCAETGSTLYFDRLNIKSFMRSPQHILYPYLTPRTSSWWSTVKERIYEKCKQYSVACRPGFGDNNV